MTIWRMRFRCWVPNATNTLKIRNTYCDSTAKTVGRSVSLLWYTYSDCIVDIHTAFHCNNGCKTHLNVPLYVHPVYCWDPHSSFIQDKSLIYIQIVSSYRAVNRLRSVIKTSQLMLYREIIAVCSQIHTKHINTLCGQNVELLNVKDRKSVV
jgi:hypothetical protein